MSDKSELPAPTVDQIPALIEALANEDPISRQKARHALTLLGPAATPALCQALKDKHEQVRWEACKTLSRIADPISAAALVAALEDEDNICWMAALGLVAIGRPAVEPLLKALIVRSSPGVILPGAHHVVYELSLMPWGTPLEEVRRAIERSEPGASTPPAALHALEAMKESGRR